MLHPFGYVRHLWRGISLFERGTRAIKLSDHLHVVGNLLVDDFLHGLCWLMRRDRSCQTPVLRLRKLGIVLARTEMEGLMRSK